MIFHIIFSALYFIVISILLYFLYETNFDSPSTLENPQSEPQLDTVITNGNKFDRKSIVRQERFEFFDNRQKEWKVCHCVLKGIFLQYSCDTDKRFSGTIKFSELAVRRSTETSETQGRSFVFILTTLSTDSSRGPQMKYCFSAASKQVVDDWIQSIQSQIDKYKQSIGQENIFDESTVPTQSAGPLAEIAANINNNVDPSSVSRKRRASSSATNSLLDRVRNWSTKASSVNSSENHDRKERGNDKAKLSSEKEKTEEMERILTVLSRSDSFSDLPSSLPGSLSVPPPSHSLPQGRVVSVKPSFSFPPATSTGETTTKILLSEPPTTHIPPLSSPPSSNSFPNRTQRSLSISSPLPLPPTDHHPATDFEPAPLALSPRSLSSFSLSKSLAPDSDDEDEVEQENCQKPILPPPPRHTQPRRSSWSGFPHPSTPTTPCQSKEYSPPSSISPQGLGTWKEVGGDESEGEGDEPREALSFQSVPSFLPSQPSPPILPPRARPVSLGPGVLSPLPSTPTPLPLGSPPPSSPSSKWSQFLFPDELLVAESLIGKRNKMGILKKRQLLLTSTPRLFYVDPSSMQITGLVPWQPPMRDRVDKINPFTFRIRLDSREFRFSDNTKGSQFWIDQISQLSDLEPRVNPNPSSSPPLSLQQMDEDD